VDIDRRRMLLGAALLAGVPSAWWGARTPVRPRLAWGGAAAFARSGDDAAVASLALCDVVDGGADPVLIEPDGSVRTVRLAGVPSEGLGWGPLTKDVGERVLALIVPDRAALARYAAAGPEGDAALELAIAAADGALAREAVDGVLANLARRQS
jgi:hypothetical protein